MKTRKNSVKFLSMALLCVIMALTFALIPINIFCVNFPEWVTVLLSVLFCSGLVAWLIVFKAKPAAKIILPVVFLFFAVVCSFAPYLIPYWNSYVFKDYNGIVLNYDEIISYEAAEGDLKALKQHLEKIHPMFKDGLTEETASVYVQALERLRTAEEISVNDLRREIQTVLHPMYDAHTSTYNNYPNDKYLKAFPQKNHEGYYITAINGIKTEQMYENAKPYFSYETEDGILIDRGSLATLDFLGYHAPFAYEWSDGENVITEIYSEADFVSWSEYLEIRDRYFVSTDTHQEFVYYEVDEEKSLAVLTLIQCVYDQTYIDCVRSMFAEVRQKNIQNVAVDLRGNGGGTSLVGNEFIRYLPVDYYLDGAFDWRWGFLTFHSTGKLRNRQYKDLTFEGNVYILTDNQTFSSAKDFAMLIQDNHLGKVVGEPSANAVNGYGEVTYFYLPNTGLYVQISTKKWYRIDETNTDEYVMPDYPCEGRNAVDKLYEVLGQ